MSPFRKNILDGKSSEVCNDCYNMDRYNKVSGRARQLLKVGITDEDFEKSLASSTYFNEFKV